MSLLGFGTSITFASGFMAEITDVDWDGIDRGDVDTTSMATTNNAMTYIPEALYDPGGLAVGLLFNPDTQPPLLSPTTNAPETITVTFRKPLGKTNAANWQALGYMSKYKWMGKVKGLYTANANLKFSGPITFTPSS
jgi:hypothetical protein